MTDESIKRFEVKSSDKRKIALVNEEELNQKYLRLSDQKKSFDLKALAKNKEAFEVETQVSLDLISFSQISANEIYEPFSSPFLF